MWARAKRALEFWREGWTGKSFMAIGAQDPVLGEPVMLRLPESIRGCPKPLVLRHAGHILQEWREKVAQAALVSFDAT